MVSSAKPSAHGPDGEPDEHVRFAGYRKAFDEVAPADAAALVAHVLTDADAAMASGAVCEYLDRRAAELLTGSGCSAWRLEMTVAVGRNDFLARRLDEWSLLRAMTVSEPWDVERLLAASNWLQLRTAEESMAVAALEVLAERGRTRRIRNIATSRLSPARRSAPGGPRR